MATHISTTPAPYQLQVLFPHMQKHMLVPLQQAAEHLMQKVKYHQVKPPKESQLCTNDNLDKQRRQQLGVATSWTGALKLAHDHGDNADKARHGKYCTTGIREQI